METEGLEQMESETVEVTMRAAERANGKKKFKGWGGRNED